MPTQNMHLPLAGDARNTLRNVENLFDANLVSRVFADESISLAQIGGGVAQLAQDPPVSTGVGPVILNDSYTATPKTATVDVSAYGDGKVVLFYYGLAEILGGTFFVDFTPSGIVLTFRLNVPASGTLTGFGFSALVNNQFDVNMSGTSGLGTVQLGLVAII